MLLIALPALVALALVAWTFRRPQDLALWALALCSSLPFITSGYLLAYGQKYAAFRVEYALVAIGLLWSVVKSVRIPPAYRSPIAVPVLCMVSVHLLSIPIALFWGTPFGIGMALKLIETYLFVVILTKVTTREHIPALVHGFLVIAFVVSVVLLTISITASPDLYDFVYRYSVPTDASGFDYVHQFRDLAYPKIWLRDADEYLPVAGVMSFVLFLLKPRQRFLFGTVAMFFLIRAISSEQRSFTAIILLGFWASAFLLTTYAKTRLRLSRMMFMGTAIGALVVTAFMFVPALGVRFLVLADRAAGTVAEVTGDRNYLGASLAIDALNGKGPIAWAIGTGAYLPSDFGLASGDINTAVVMVYKFGVVGLAAIAFLLMRAWQVTWAVLRRVEVSPEECAVVIGLLVYIAGALLTSFFRGFIFVEDFHSTAGFVILLSWVEVMHRQSAIAYWLEARRQRQVRAMSVATA